MSLRRGASSLAVFTLSMGTTWVAMNACSSPQVVRPEPSIASKAAAEPPAASCRAKQAKRAFVGFAPGAGLKSFEASAAQAVRILAMLEAGLCSLDDAQDRGGSLRNAGTQGVLSITEVRFTSADLRSAQAQVELVVSGPAPPVARKPQTWAIDIVQDDTGWQVVSTTPR